MGDNRLQCPRVRHSRSRIVIRLLCSERKRNISLKPTFSLFFIIYVSPKIISTNSILTVATFITCSNRLTPRKPIICCSLERPRFGLKCGPAVTSSQRREWPRNQRASTAAVEKSMLPTCCLELSPRMNFNRRCTFSLFFFFFPFLALRLPILITLAITVIPRVYNRLN